jgi:hypothetical protein
MDTVATGETGGKDLVAELLASGKTLPAELRSRFLAQGTANVPRLLQLLEHREFADEDSPGSGWAPVHAVELLIELRVTEAVLPMLRALEQTHWSDLLHDRILIRLPEMGAVVLEPALAALGRNDDEDLRHSFCAVLSQLAFRTSAFTRSFARSSRRIRRWEPAASATTATLGHFRCSSEPYGTSSPTGPRLRR